VHPTQPYLVSSSDDTTIKLWDIEKNFTLIRTLDEHVHYVMMVQINPRDLNSFASASLDKTVKVKNVISD
jgi:coatomer subunit beta'